MSWLFSRALVEAYSAGNCSDGEPSAQLNVMPTQHKFWRNDKMMEFSNLSLFGLTLKLLTEDRGMDLLTWYREDFLAKIFPSQEKAQDYPMEPEADYGRSKHASFAKCSQDMRMWKTAQHSLFEDLDTSLAIWPKWGLMRDGECLEVTSLVPLINQTASGFWHPTPTARDWKGASNGQKLDYSRWTTYLHHAVSHDHYTTYPNPSCSEAVMGWPIGWTELAPLEMGRFQQWQQQHSLCLLGEPEYSTRSAA